MKKISCLLILSLLLFGCSVIKVKKPINGLITCSKETTTIINDTVEFPTYSETEIVVSNGYIKTIIQKHYLTYKDISTYFQKTPQDYYNKLLWSYENSVSEPGFGLMPPVNNGEAIIDSSFIDYNDLSIIKEIYLPTKALSKNKTKVLYDKYIENYLSDCNCQLIK